MSLSDQLWIPTTAQVTVLQARGLRIKGKNGTNDAYAVMQLGKEKYQTSVAEKTVAPVWKEEASFDMPSANQGGTERGTLHVHVLHRALVGPDKLLGQAVLNLIQLSENQSRDKTQWFKLLDKSGKPDKDRGEVLLDIQFTRNNMTASMFDISAAGKSRSRLSKFKDKVRGKKKEDALSETSSNVVTAFSQVMTDSEEDGGSDGDGAAAGTEPKKKNKVKSLFSHKTNLQKSFSQSMSVLPGKNSPLSGSMSSGLNVEASEGKKKFKFLSHKRTGSSGKKDQKLLAEQSNLCINGSHVYCEEPAPRTSRASSNFSLASSGVGSMEDVPDSSPPSVGSRRSVRHSFPWTEEEEEETIEASTQEVGEEIFRRQELEKLAQDESRMEEEERRREEEEKRRREEEERIRMDEEKRRQDEEIRTEEKRKRREDQERKEEELRMDREREEQRVEEARKLDEERIRFEREKERRREEEERLEEEQERIKQEEEERRRFEKEKAALERKRIEEEEQRVRKEQEEYQRLRAEQRKLEEEEKRRRDKDRLAEEERRQEKERQRREEEKLEQTRLAEQERREKEEEKIREEEKLERERLAEEERRKREEEKLEKARLAEEEQRREEEERRKREEEKLEKARLAEEAQRREEEERLKREEEKLEKARLAEEEQRREEEEKLEKARLAEEEQRREEEERRKREEEKLEKARLAEEAQRREEERLKREEEKLEKARLAEEEQIREEEERRKREEEKLKKAEQERRQKEEKERREEEKLEMARLAEEERLRREEEKLEKERLAEEEQRREEEKRRKEEEERQRKEEEAQKRKEKLEKERLAEEERRRENEGRQRREKEVRQRKEEEEKQEKERLVEEERRQEEKRRQEEEEGMEEPQRHVKTAADTHDCADITSTNPFEESDEDNPFEDVPERTVTSARQRSKLPVDRNTCSFGEKDVSVTREKRQAPKPPRMNLSERQRAAQHEAQANKSSRDIKTASILPQRAVQKINPVVVASSPTNNSGKTDRSSGRKPAPQRPGLTEEEILLPKVSQGPILKSKQAPAVSSYNPFEDNEDVDALSDTTATAASAKCSPPLEQSIVKDTVSEIKAKSSKTVHAPTPPAENNRTLGTDTSLKVTQSDVDVEKDCAPVQETLHKEVAQEEAVKKDAPSVPSRRLQPVRPLNSLNQPPVSTIQINKQKADKPSGEIINSQGNENVKDTGPYALLTREELISLVLKQESQLLEKSKKISELEQYIDQLLVRVIEEAPNILMTMTPLK